MIRTASEADPVPHAGADPDAPPCPCDAAEGYRLPPSGRVEAAGLAVIRWAFRTLGPAFPGPMGRFAVRLFTRPRKHAPPKFEQEIAAEAEHFTIDFNGMPLRALAWGTGPVVLLVHGWEGRGAQLARFMGPLAGCGYRVVAFDGPAHGASPGKAVEVSSMADAVIAAGRALGPLHGVIAHSFGGAATALALHRGLDARRVALVGMPDALMHVIGRFQAVVGLEGSAFEAFLDALAARLGARPEALDVADIAGTLDTPALIVHDRGDTEVPCVEGWRVHRHWPGSAFLATDGLGHRRILKAQPVIGAVHRFLAGSA